MSGQTPHDQIATAFQQAVTDFKSQVNNDVYQQILATRTIDDVYDATDKLQQEQAKEGHLRHLGKIEPFLTNMKEYASTIEVFLQAKPDVLALIWGPVKLLLQWTMVLKQSFDAITNTLGEIGRLLPEFKRMDMIFKGRPAIQEVLVLFFKDILEFYAVTLKFFSLRRWNIVFESMWPRHREKIKVIMGNIECHKSLFRDEIRLEDIEAAHQARKRAIQVAEAEEQAHRHQEYQGIRQYISPESYAKKRSWLDIRACPGTETWLTADDVFKNWIDVDNLTTNFLFLQGIPGAGKTFLSGLVVKKTIQLKKTTAYAFLSYSQSEDTSALSVLQSLLFHLAEDSKDIQDILCRSSRTNLKSDIQTAFGLLVDAINVSGLVFIVVDGLDEMQYLERRELLGHLLRLNQACIEVKILVSSRAESDILLELKDKPTIRVDNHNTASIKRFVFQSADEWFRAIKFPAGVQSEIRALLEPLPSSSQGMFLYARIMLDVVQELDVLEDIRSELRVLPASLDEAYARIFARINKSKSIPKQKARKLLGWIGCSPTPMTVQELEHALAIKYENEISGHEPAVTGMLDAIRVCGPMVEVVNDIVQFVHFTVKEYIFSPDISDHINLSDATLGLTSCCLFYLRLYHHDSKMTNDDIKKSILSGSYRFHDFANTMWYNLLETYYISTRPPSIAPNLLDRLELFADNKGKGIESGEQMPKSGLDSGIWDSLETTSPETYSFLCKFKQFRDVLTTAEFSINKDDWTHLDPTSISPLSVRVHQMLNELLSHSSGRASEQQQAIERCYGRRPFKCSFVNCAYHRHGFESHTLRQKHQMNHERPWKCSLPDCEFANQGFLSRKMRDEHMNLYHSPEKSVISSDFSIYNVDPWTLVSDLVEAGQVEHLRTFMERIKDTLGNGIRGGLYESAARTASPEILEIFHDNFSLFDNDKIDYYVRCALKASAEATNTSTFRCIMKNIPISRIWDKSISECSNYQPLRLDCDNMLPAVLTIQDHTIWDEWYTSFQQVVSKWVLRTTKIRIEILPWGVFVALDRRNSGQLLLLKMWKLLLDEKLISHSELSRALSFAARCPTLTRLAKFCLDHGADVNYRQSNKYSTALHYSVRRSSIEAANMTKLLLFRGADANADLEPRKYKSGNSVRRIRDEIGAQEIQNWLGKTWDELVAEAEAFRKRGERFSLVEGDSFV